MADPIDASLRVAASGVRAQSVRLRIISENIANADSTAAVPGGDPYGRKTITFVDALDEVSGATLVSVGGVGRDQTPFRLERDPGHPAADAAGFVKRPNVSPLVEMADLREANHSYEANLQVVRQAHAMLGQLIDLLRAK